MCEAERVPTLVLGLGNPILGDDGVGWRVVDELEARLARVGGSGPAGRPVSGARAAPTELPAVELDRLASGGLRLMERLVGYERAILVDAMATGCARPGTVRCLRLDDLPAPADARLASPHDASLGAALDLGRQLGARLPETPWVVAVEAGPGCEFSTQLSPAVARAVPDAADAVLRLLGEAGAGYRAGSEPGEGLPGPEQRER